MAYVLGTHNMFWLRNQKNIFFLLRLSPGLPCCEISLALFYVSVVSRVWAFVRACVRVNFYKKIHLRKDRYGN